MTRVLTPVFFALMVVAGAALAGPTNGAEGPEGPALVSTQ